jgi:hypothetical protein
MGLEHERTHSAGVHTCHTPDCMNFRLLTMAQHLAFPHPLRHVSYISVQMLPTYQYIVNSIVFHILLDGATWLLT